MPIYRVTAEIEVMVYGDNEEDASHAAEEAVRDAISDDPYGCMSVWSPTQVTDPRNLGDWHNCRPYNREGDDSTCTQLMEQEAAKEKARPPTTEEIEAAGQQRLIA